MVLRTTLYITPMNLPDLTVVNETTEETMILIGGVDCDECDVVYLANSDIITISATGYRTITNTAEFFSDNPYVNLEQILEVANLSDGVNTYQIKDAVARAMITTAFDAAFPVGSLYMSKGSTCPLATLIPNSTWVLISSGKALWTGDGTNGGTTINAGVPDITGSITLRDMAQAQSDADGAFALDTTASSGNYTGTNQYSRQYFRANFSASSSNSIYGASNTVQPPAYVVNVWERTA